jgi:hypothetical protein
MKKAVSKEALDREAAFWEAIKKTVSEQPHKVCHK